VVLLDFWGTWCGPCVAGVPELVRLYAAYHPRGFEILGIEARDTREKVAAFIAEHHMPWPQTLEKETDPITTRYRVDGWPTAFLVGPDGTFLEANYLGEVRLADQLAKAFPSTSYSDFNAVTGSNRNARAAGPATAETAASTTRPVAPRNTTGSCALRPKR